MALPKLFQRIFWHNNTTPAINEDNLNAMSKAIDDIDDRVIEREGTIMEAVANANTSALNAAQSEANAQNYASQASSAATNAINANTAAQTAATNAANSATSAANSATTATNKATEAAEASTSANTNALKAEGYAVGKQNGSDVSSGSPYYHANAKYYADKASDLNENPPYIGANGNWYVYDITTGAYVDSGVDASITVTMEDVHMLEYGSSPYVINSGTNTDPIFHLYLPEAKSAYECALDGGYIGTEAQFNDALSNFQIYASTAQTAATNASESAQDAEAYATGKRGGVDVSTSDDAYHNNAKWYSEQASSSASDAHEDMLDAAQSASDAATSESNASTSASNASTSALTAQNHALDAEAWAVGQRNGSDVASDDVTYENNSKYYAQAAETTKSQILAIYQEVVVYKNLLEIFFGTLNLITENGDRFITESGDYIAIDY